MKEGGRDRHARRRRERTGAILIAVFICIAAVALILYMIQVINRHRVENEFARLADETWSNAENSDSGTDDIQISQSENIEEQTESEKDPLERLQEMGVPIPEKEVDITELQEEINADIYAWIYIPDNNIDYPVLQHPSDNSFYLENNIDGSKGLPGCIYTENYNKKDFSDPNTIMYGHNMKAGTMFADLHKFEDSEYFEEHPYVYVYMEEELLVYEVFAAYETGNEHIMFLCDFNDPAQYGKYLEEIFQIRSMSANIREGVTVTEDNRILTLSTCMTGKPDSRYLVQGVLLNEN